MVRRGFSKVQLQPLIDSTDRLAHVYQEADMARRDHEQNVIDMRNWRAPSRTGTAALKWIS